MPSEQLDSTSDYNPPDAEGEELNAIDRTNQYEEDVHEVQYDGPPAGYLPFLEPGLSLEESNIIFNQKHPTTSQWRDSEGPQGFPRDRCPYSTDKI